MLRWLLVFPLVFAVYAVGRVALHTTPNAKPDAVVDYSHTSVEKVYASGFVGTWNDWGWSPRELKPNAPAAVDMSGYGGWIVGTHSAHVPCQALRFKARAAIALSDFLELRLRQKNGPDFPALKVAPTQVTRFDDNWHLVTLPMTQLNPATQNFDQIVFRAGRSIDTRWVTFDDIELLGCKEAAVTIAEAQHKPLVATRNAALRIDCQGPRHRISPLIYGIAFSPRTEAKDGYLWRLQPGARRWGGNATSRFNWRLGNAWNTASDWYFRNVNYTGDPNYSWRRFLDDNQQHSVASTLTVPLLGWVAKDTESYSYPVSIYGPQESIEPGRPDVGNGRGVAGEALEQAPPDRTSVESTARDVGLWVSTINKREQQEKRDAVAMYFLGNEPMLWHSTHRDVRSQPLGYDELLQRSIDYGQAIRSADANAVIAGPAVWGWPAYFYSAKDMEAGVRLRPDRRAHGDQPLLEWYLHQLDAHRRKTGVRILDALDVHFYPQARGVHSPTGGQLDDNTAALRIRSTRALWDRDYVDESWIKEPVELLPRLERLVAPYPGLRYSIGEYSFGGDTHISGALAVAEALGRFSQAPKLLAAFYWTYPPDNSPAYHAFRAYRDYDGKGAQFGNWSLASQSAPRVSLFASYDEKTKRVVAVLVNLDAKDVVAARVDVSTCATASQQRAFRYQQGSLQIDDVSTLMQVQDNTVSTVLPAYSITVLEFAAVLTLPQ